MFNNIILKINILPFMIGIRHTDVKGISGGNPACPPPVSASLRRHLRCFGSHAGTSLTLRCGPDGPFRKSCLSTPSHLTVTAPSGHAAPLRYAGTSSASVSLPETLLTLRCGPEGPSHLNPQSLSDSPLLRGATPFLPPRREPCRRPQACSRKEVIRCNLIN